MDDVYNMSAMMIQKIYRGYKVRASILIPSSEYQTKKWRQNRKWYISGKRNECEIYQRYTIEQIINKKCNKTDLRINTESMEIIKNKCPMNSADGFEWTEDFDGIVQENINGSELNKEIVLNDGTNLNNGTIWKLYFNLKFVCDKGGAQTRTLRCVYDFIRYQLEYLLKFRDCKVIFINILDGDSLRRSQFSSFRMR